MFTQYDGKMRWDWMQRAITLIRERAMVGDFLLRNGWDALPDSFKESHPKHLASDCMQRAWRHNHMKRFAHMHPVIRDAVLLAPPRDWHLLVLEWPHRSVTDPNRIAYTRDERAGREDKQTVTSVGKYLTRHFPTLADHQIRDLAAQYAVGNDTFKIVRTTEEIVDYLHRGPNSCMLWSSDEDDEWDGDPYEHPYVAYAPELGWGLAVRMTGSMVNGRALVNDRQKCFVRTYRRNDDGYSHTDEALGSWLTSQGYTRQDGWPEGTAMKLVPRSTRWGDRMFWAPYIDGRNQDVVIYGDELHICGHGDFTCTNTDGYPQENEICTCDSCNDRVHEDDRCWVGRHGDYAVCNLCFEDYVQVYGRRGDSYYLHMDDAVEVGGEHYDPEYLSDNSIVELYDGGYRHIDDAVCIGDEWYDVDDSRIVTCEDDGEMHIEDEGCWQCDHSNNWYTDYVTPVHICEMDGNVIAIHPDYESEYEADLSVDLTADETLTIEGA